MNINIANGEREIRNNGMQTANVHTSSQHHVAKTASAAREFSVDLSTKSKDKASFGMENLKSVDDVKAKAAVKDISLEHNAYAVMAGSMSSEELAKMQKEGFSPADMTPEETVTNIDKIKAVMVASGADIPGYTDDLSSAEIEKITGSMSAAIAIESALKENQVPINEENVESINDAIKLSESVDAPTDDAKKYMINNDLEPTVNNIYMANHSSSDANSGNVAAFYKDSTGYVGMNSTDCDFQELKPQVEKIIKEAGLEVNDSTVKEAQWLIEQNIPLNKENLINLQELNSIAFPLEEDVVARASAAAIADGTSVKEASLINTESIAVKAGKFMKEVENEASKQASSGTISKAQLEEIRLQLTAEASVALLKKGITVDTSDLQKLVQELKEAEKEAYAPFLMDEKYENVPANKKTEYDSELELKLDLFKSTQSAIEAAKSAPVDVIADIVKSAQNADTAGLTLSDVADASERIKADYDKANKSYETMMTAPRRDLGDSIKKAFRNVDDILEDMDIEVTRLNEKAVRILGYSGMEINDDNIEKAVRAEVAVENVISHMTPARTLKMIRDGENPLDTDIYKLADDLVNEDEDDSNVRYTEFLYKLEKSGDITEAEKSAFIGLYRLFRKIEKSDGKLVGDVIKSDERLTLSNILSASRSDRQIGNDYKIDDNFGVLQSLVKSGTSITEQILKGFDTKELNEEYAKEEASDIKKMMTNEEAVLDALENIREPESPVNMAAMDAIINSRGSMFKELKKAIDKNAKEDEENVDLYKSSVSELHDSFTDEESATKAYEKFAKNADEIIKNEAENADNYIDVKSVKLLNKQLSIVSKMADRGTYEVPVEINGEITSINLKLISDADNAGKVKATFETESTGKVSAEFTLRDGDVSGFIVTENSYFEGVIKEKDAALKDEFEGAGVNIKSMYYTSSRGLNIKGNYTEEAGTDTANTKQLYSVAKAIIKAIQK